MKKIVIYIFIISTIIFLLLSIYDIFGYKTNKNAINNFLKNNFNEAFEDYKKINENKLSQNNKEILNYNKGVTLLNKGIKNILNNEIDESLKNFKKSENYLQKVQNNEYKSYSKEVLGDMYFLTGTGYLKINNLEQTIKNREKSIKHYEELLNIKNGDKKITEKYEYVKKELEKLLKKVNQDKRNDDKGGENESKKNSSGSENKENNQKKETPKNIEGNKWKNTGQFNTMQENKNEAKKGGKITKKELQELELYSKMLDEFQKNNQDLMPKGDEKSSNEIGDIFSNNVSLDEFFDNNIGENLDKKDW